MPLDYLIFDASDDGQGTGSWEAMASVQPANWPALMAEVQAVLDAAARHAPGPRGPLDDGGVWDVEFQQQPDGDRLLLTLTLTGPWDWGEALLENLSRPA